MYLYKDEDKKALPKIEESYNIRKKLVHENDIEIAKSYHLYNSLNL